MLTMAEFFKFEKFNKEIAQYVINASDKQKGLPAFLGIKLVEFGPGTLKAEIQVRDEFLTMFGNMHGGVLAAFIDHILGAVIYPLIEPGQWAATIEFKLNYISPVSKGNLKAEAEVISMTRSTAVVRASVNNEGRLCCSAQGTLIIRDPKK